MKPQEPWIGKRARIGVIIPSTNIGVEYDCQRIIPPGVTWHFARFFVSQPDLSSDNMFLAFIDAIRDTIPDAMRDIMTCEPSYIMMGMSAETFWGGLEGNVEFEARLRDMIGPNMGLTSGAAALKDAIDCFGAKTVAAITPYQSVGDEQVHRFLEESGYNVTKVIGLKCDTATSIASAFPGGTAMVVQGTPDYASDTSFASSAPQRPARSGRNSTSECGRSHSTAGRSPAPATVAVTSAD
jgi:maleate isomerase